MRRFSNLELENFIIISRFLFEWRKLKLRKFYFLLTFKDFRKKFRKILEFIKKLEILKFWNIFFSTFKTIFLVFEKEKGNLQLPSMCLKSFVFILLWRNFITSSWLKSFNFFFNCIKILFFLFFYLDFIKSSLKIMNQINLFTKQTNKKLIYISF